MIYVGIDPGKEGALYTLDEETNELKFIDMPVYPDGEIDEGGIWDFFLPYIKEGKKLFIILEQAQYMPKFKDGVLIKAGQNTFNYGSGFGVVKAVLRLLVKICKVKYPNCLSFQQVRPSIWKKEFNLGDDKRDSVMKAIDLFPSQQSVLRGPRGGYKHDRAEALLMLEYGRRIYKK